MSSKYLDCSLSSQFQAIDSKSQEILVDLYSHNPNFNSSLLIEDYLNDESNHHTIDGDFHEIIQIIEDCSVLRYSFLDLYKQLDQFRSSTNKQAKESSKSNKKFVNYITLDVSQSKNLNQIDVSSLIDLFANQGSISKKINSNLKDLNLTDEIRQEIQLLQSLEDLLISYILIIQTQLLLNDLLTTNLKIVDDLNYYALLSDDHYYIRKVYHLIKVSPIIGSKFFKNLKTEFMKIKNNEIGFTAENFDKIKKLLYNKLNENFHSITAKPYNILVSEIKDYKRFTKTSSIKISSPIDIILKPFNKVKDIIWEYLTWINSWFDYPKTLIDGYFNNKVDQLKELKYHNITKLGELIKELPHFEEDEEPNFKDINHSMMYKLVKLVDNNDNFIQQTESYTLLPDLINKILPNYSNKVGSQLNDLKIPGFFLNNWPILGLITIYGPSSIYTIYANRYEIFYWFKDKFYDTLVKFFENWVITPIFNIFKTIRHDENSQISIISKKSLYSDIESLERMVIEYLQKTHNFPTNSQDIEILQQNIKDGDLTEFMKVYEKQIQSPLKNIVLGGGLLQSILIQIQKVKVDGNLVINGIDKLLKSQELVFELIAILPSGLIIIWIMNNTRTIMQKGWRNTWIINVNHSKDVIKLNLNRIERLLITNNDENDEDYYFHMGELIIEILSLKKNFSMVLNSANKTLWKYCVMDIDDLSNAKINNEKKIQIIEKIWRNYGEFLK